MPTAETTSLLSIEINDCKATVMSKPVSLSRRALHRLFLRPNKRQRLRHLARLRLIEQLEMRALLTGVTLIDLNQTPAGSDPSAVVVVGDRGCSRRVTELMDVNFGRTDGTEAGTVLVKDIQPGPSGLLLASPVSHKASMLAELYFSLLMSSPMVKNCERAMALKRELYW
ncbi:MAG: hypothetical protein R3C56_30270 [Pirellulaceae bacterium]